jgi:hypothetical protein
MAIDGDASTLLVGEPGANVDDGRAYVFDRSGSTWSEGDTLAAPGSGHGSRFGASVSIDRSGFRAVLGGPDAATRSGAVAVFGLSPTGWEHVIDVTEETPELLAEFGTAVSFAGTGDYFAVGVPQADTLIRDTGKVVIFTAAGELGVPCGEAAGCQSGFCVDGVCCESACGGSPDDCMGCNETITGMADGTCAVALSGTACGDPSDSECTAPDTCDGSGTCIANHVADDTPCTGGSYCTSGDACAAGVCVEGSAPTCDPATLKCDEDGDACYARCGDGVVDSGEECDEGGANSDAVDASCRTDCTDAGCGDGVVDSGEECDDGASNSDSAADACRTDCSAAGCGDGVVDTGEDCDEGEESATCTASCTTPGVDAGPTPTDAGASADAGSIDSDAGVADRDAGPAVDGGETGGGEDGGCGCRAAPRPRGPSAGWLMLGLGLALRLGGARRRRRRR